MARVNAQQWLDKWGRRLQAAGPDIQAGVNRVQRAPGQDAAAAADRMLLGVQQAIQDGTWQANVGKVTLQEWKDSMINKGVPRLAQGVTAAQKNGTAKIQELLSAVDAAAAAANALPKGSLEQNIQRSITFQREMAARAPKRNR